MAPRAVGPPAAGAVPGRRPAMSEPEPDESDRWYRRFRLLKAVVTLLAGLVTVGRALGLV